MKAKIYLKRIVSIILILLITHLVLIFTQVRYDHNNIAIEGFYKEEKNSLDVVVLGASEVYSDYSPVYAYQQYGYTSYIFAIDDNPFILYSWELDEIYRYQNPKLVMIEISSILPDREMEVGEDYFDATLRKLSDSVPLSEKKLELLNTYGVRDPLESYLYPPIKYHGMLPTPKHIKNGILTRITFSMRRVSYLKGYLSRTLCEEYSTKKDIDVIGDTTTEPIPEREEMLLNEFLDHCDEKGYQVIFTRFPHRIHNELRYHQYCQDNRVAEIITSRGYTFVDFEQNVEEIGIDKLYDFNNTSHLRASGSKKFTDYVGKLLTQEYGITPSELSESCRRDWDECTKYMDAFYELYEEEKDTEPNKYLQEDFDMISKLSSMIK